MKRERVREICSGYDWGALDHAYGFATDVPFVFEALVCGDDAARRNALWELYGNVFHQGTRYGASPAAMRVAVRLVLESSGPYRGDLLGLCVSLLIGYEDEFIMTGYRWSELDRPGGLLEELQRTFDGSRSAFSGLLDDEDRRVRMGAAHCLGWISDDVDSVKRALRDRFGREKDAEVRATILFALAMHGDVELAKRALDDADALVRTFAAIAIVRVEGKKAPPAAKGLALSATSHPRTAIPFGHGAVSQLASEVTRAIEGANEDPDVIRTLIQALRGASMFDALSQAQLLLSGAFPKPLEGAPSELQREAIRAVVETDAAWIILNIEDSLQACGLPNKREELATFAGIDLSIDKARFDKLQADFIAARLPHAAPKPPPASGKQPAVVRAPDEIVETDLPNVPRSLEGPFEKGAVNRLELSGNVLTCMGEFGAAAIDLESGSVTDVSEWSGVRYRNAPELPHAGTIQYRGPEGTWEASTNAHIAGFALDDTHVFVVGSFTRVNGEPRHYLVVIERASGKLTPLRVDLDKPAFCVARAGEHVFVGGGFRHAGYDDVGSLIAIRVADGSVRSIPPAAPGSVNVLAVGERDVFAVGACAMLIDQKSLAAREVPLALRAKHGRGTVSRAAFRGDRIILAGAFTHVDDVERSGIAEIDDRGRLSAWNPNVKLAGRRPAVRSIVCRDDLVAIAGSFTIGAVTNLALFHRAH